MDFLRIYQCFLPEKFLNEYTDSVDKILKILNYKLQKPMPCKMIKPMFKKVQYRCKRNCRIRTCEKKNNCDFFA